MVNNPNFYGQSTHGTPNQIEDGVDFPHTGIVKALSHGLGQNYAISGFNITVDSATQIDVSAGVVFRDGRKLSVLGANNLTLSSTHTNGYHLLVAPIESDEDSNGSTPDTSTVVLRNPTAADKVPEYTAGDTIIAVITHNGTANVGIQYLTVNKTENSLSIGRDNSGYTEGLTIQSNAGDIEIEALEQDKDIIFKANDGGASTEVMRVDGSSSRVGIGATAPTAKLEVKGDTAISRSVDSGQTRTLSIEGARNAAGTDYARIDLENYDSNGPTSYVGARISAVNEADGVNDGSLVFSTNNANAGIAERMRIDDAGNVGIGTNAPSEKLTVSGNIRASGDIQIDGVQYNQFQDLSDDIATGYHTIAHIDGWNGAGNGSSANQQQRGIGTFFIRNTDSSRHQSIILTASHLFGAGNGNGISVEHASHFSTVGISAVRIKEGSTYDGAVLQIQIANATNNIEVFLKNNFQEDGWVLNDAVADADNTAHDNLGVGSSNNYSAFNIVSTTDITGITGNGRHIQGRLVVGSIRSGGDIEIDGSLNHDGSNVGFYGISPATRQSVGALGGNAINPTAGAGFVDPTATGLFTSDQGLYLANVEQEITNLRTKLDALITALTTTGLIS
tara:strand:- start:394 stop:2250 length:1857 start_codon:yes stop_codon:yes gene_type:complete